MELEKLEAHKQILLQDVCRELRARGVTKIIAAYDGVGDSGSVESAQLFGPDGNEVAINALSDMPSFGTHQQYDQGGRRTVPDDIAWTLDDIICEILPGGWEINEGSFGTVTIDTETRKGTVEHSWRVESTQEEEFQF